MNTGRIEVHAGRADPPVQSRRPRAERARPDAAAVLSSPAAASSGARPIIPPEDARRTPFPHPYLGTRALALIGRLFGASLVALLYVLVERTLDAPVPALVVTAVLGTWVVSILASGPSARGR